MEVAARLDRLRARFGEAGCEALIVTKLVNVAYLTGFTGSAATLVVTQGSALLVTDGRYQDQAPAELAAAGVAAELEIGAQPAQLDAIAAAVSARGRTCRVGLEAHDVPWSRQRRFVELLEPCEIVATERLVEALRAVKDEGEVARIEQACSIADVALAQVKQRLAERPTEAEVAADLEHEMRRRGSAKAAFETIVASGPNSALPHARPTGRVIEEGDLVVVDFGATVDGYRSDMTRTLCAGMPVAALAELLDAVLASQRAGLRALRAGVSGAEVDAACRKVLAEAGLGDAFLHGTGHGVGLEIHEAPWLGAGSADILGAGSVVTVEPGAYLPGIGGARIEDTVVVGAGGTRLLTRSTKDFSI